MHDKDKVVNIFRGLQCMKYDEIYSRWVWLYQEEAIHIELPKKYADIPNNLHPLVLGSFFTREDDEMFLDVRSIERAGKAAVFFD